MVSLSIWQTKRNYYDLKIILSLFQVKRKSKRLNGANEI
ncbi:hypothetical protein CHCC20348_2237 [Bacillus paralicheniformis]|nr:hypothetical protein CHCC20348_2237 [Bacillus paralicheniformis]